MYLPTYSDIKTKLFNDLDLWDEDFISETEFLGYLNEAIADCEAEIHTLGLEARYFLNTDNPNLVINQSDYAMPSDIYANKIVKFFYINGPKNYEIMRVRNLQDIPLFQAGDDYQYMIFNLTAGIVQRIMPTPTEATGAWFFRYYIRNVKKLTTSTSDPTNVCEVPEAINFIYAHARMRISGKENNGTPQPETLTNLKLQHDLMVQTLQEMCPDENNIIQPDLTFYSDSSTDFWRY